MNGDPLIREVIANHIILKEIDTVCNAMWLYILQKMVVVVFLRAHHSKNSFKKSTLPKCFWSLE